jgi:hypothetical protein
VTHELGHAICQKKNQRAANGYGNELRDGKIPHCKSAAPLQAARAK